MINRRVALLGGLLAASTTSVFANGGVFTTSVVQRTGNLVPRQERSVQLDSENLRIAIHEDDASVEVDYELLNRGGERTVTFGFPVDIATSLPTPNGFDYVLSNSLRQFQIKDGDRAIPVERTIDEPLRHNQLPTGIEPELKLIRRWSLAPIHFARGEHKRLHVSYVVRCMARDEGFEGDIDWKFGQRVFCYTFRPAATWGNGHVRQLNVSVNIGWLRTRGLSVGEIAPANHGSRSGDVLEWSLHDVDFARAEDLRFSYDPSPFYRERLIARNMIAKKGVASFHSTGANGTEAMRDNQPSTAWHGQVGDSIVLRPKNRYIQAIGFLNGAVASRSNYYASGRIKRLRIKCEFSGDVDPDHRHLTVETTLLNRQYEDLNLRYPLATADWVLEHPQGDGVLDRAELTILDVYPGTDGKTCAVSELYLCGFEYRRDASETGQQSSH